MAKEIQEQAQKLFELGQKAGLISEISLDKFISDKQLTEISEQLNSDKASFIEANSQLSNFSQLWEEAEKSKIQDALVWHLINFAVKNHQGVGLDWKFSADDVVFNIKQVLPDLDLKGLGEKEIAGEWGESILLEGEEFRFLREEGEMITEIFKVVNAHLEKTGKVFVLSSAGFDDIYYLLINITCVPEFEALGFISI